MRMVRKRKKPKQVKTRLQASRDKRLKDQNKISAETKDLSSPFSPDQLTKISKFWRGKATQNEFDLKDPRALIRDLEIKAETLELVKISREKYLEAISKIYAFHEDLLTQPNRDDLIDAFCRAQRHKFTKKTDIVAICARQFIKYQPHTDGLSADEIKIDADRARKASARDAAAIHYLRSIPVHPQDVIAYQAENGGGLDEWARLWHAKNKSEKESSGGEPRPSSAPKEPQVIVNQQLNDKGDLGERETFTKSDIAVAAHMGKTMNLAAARNASEVQDLDKDEGEVDTLHESQWPITLGVVYKAKDGSVVTALTINFTNVTYDRMVRGIFPKIQRAVAQFATITQVQSDDFLPDDYVEIVAS